MHRGAALTVKSCGGLWMATLVRVHHEGDFPVLPPHVLKACIEGQIQPLVGIQLESP